MTMLDRMRRHKSWLKWSLAVVVLAFVFLYIPDFMQGTTSTETSSTDIVAEVEGHEITAGEFQRRYRIQLQAYQTSYGETMNIEILKQLGIDRQILQQLVDERAALSEAERQGISVTDEELAQQIFAIPAFQLDGRFAGEQQYEQVLRSQQPPITKAEFEDSLRESLMVDRLRDTLTGWLSVPDEEVDREYLRRNEKVKLQVLAVQTGALRDQVTVTEADVTAHYGTNKDDYRVGERRKITFLLIDTDAIRANTTVPAADVSAFYNDNIQQYSTPEQIRARHILLETEGKDEAEVRARAEEVLKEVQADGDFAALATKYSEDEASKALGGDLDYFQRGRMVPEFDTAAFALDAGQVSDLVKSPFGFHIIKVEDKKGGTTRTLDETRVEITEQLKFRRSQDAAAAQASALAARITVAADLERVAKEEGLTTTESGLFLRDEPVPGIGGAPQIAQQAFALADGAVSAPIGSPRGPVFITVTGKEEPYVPALDDVNDEVREDLITEGANALAMERAQTVATALRSTRDFTAAAKARGFEVTETPLIAREAAIPGIGVSADVDRAAFALPVGGVSDPIVTQTATVIVRVAEREDVAPETLQETHAAFQRELEDEQRGQFFSAYMAKAKQKMTIAVHDDVLQRMVGDQ
jgi:peptidyl-prolyl cis-trans isomerase D